MDQLTLAYLAGAMDADGWFTIKRTTQRKRNRGDCQSIIYKPALGLGQILPQVCDLLKATFGGSIHLQKGGTENSKPQFKYGCADRQAVVACQLLLPFLRLKGERAKVLIDLFEFKTNSDHRCPTYWWLLENAGWETGQLLTSAEVMSRLGYAHPTCISQAIENGLLVALPYRHNRWAPPPKRFPAGLIDFLASLRGRTDGRYVRYKLPPQFITRCDELYQKVRAMNSLGVSGTCITHRTGYFKPIE